MNGDEDVAFSPAGDLIAGAGDDNMVYVWDAATSELKHTLDGHTDTITRVAFSQDGKLLASGGAKAKVVLWDTATGEPQRELRWDEGQVIDLAFSPDGRTLATTSDEGNARLWEVETGAVRCALHLTEYLGRKSKIKSISFNADGSVLASGRGTLGQPATLWDTTTGEVVEKLPKAAGYVESVSFSPDGTVLATGNKSGIVLLWKVD